MRSTANEAPQSWIRRFLGRDEPLDLVHFIAVFAVFGVLDRLTLSFASLAPADLFTPILFVRAPLDHPLQACLLVAGVCGLTIIGRSKLWSSWGVLDHGDVLRGIGAMVVLWLAWRTSAYDFNYVLGQWHAVDRGLVLVLAAGSLLRRSSYFPL